MTDGERSHNFSPHSTPAATFARGLLSKGVSVPSGSFQPKLAVRETPTADGLALIKIFLSAQQSQRVKAHLLHPILL
jgi:hypothetical protein